MMLKETIRSNAYSYPLLGIYYIAKSPSLYKSVTPVLIQAITTSIGITVALFFFTYLPHVAFCAIFTGPLAFFPAAIMVLGEAYFLVMFASKTFFLGPAQDRLFDAVLLEKGNEKLVQRGRLITKSSSGYRQLGKSLTRPLRRLSKEGILKYLISLPLNMIPVVGTAVFLLYNGTRTGPVFHARYFQLKEFDKQKRQQFVEKNKGAYAAFGTVALALNLIPVVGLLFDFTSNVGAALWAHELEQEDSKQ